MLADGRGSWAPCRPVGLNAEPVPLTSEPGAGAVFVLDSTLAFSCAYSILQFGKGEEDVGNGKNKVQHKTKKPQCCAEEVTVRDPLELHWIGLNPACILT